MSNDHPLAGADLSELGVPDDPKEREQWANDRERELHEELERDVRQTEADKRKAVAQLGGDVERYEEIQIGEESVPIKAWLPGRAQEIAASINDADDEREAFGHACELLSILVKDGEEIEGEPLDADFWREYYDYWGFTGLMRVVHQMFDVATEGLEDSKDLADGFRQE